MVKVRGSVSRYDDRAQLKVDQLRKALDGEADKMDMLPATSRDVGELWAQLEASVESLTNPDLKRLLKALLADAGDRAGVSRGAGGAATASCVAGRAAGARGEPAGAWPIAWPRTIRCSTAICSSPA